MKTHSDWCDLPSELLADIAKRLSSIHDYLCFRGVCSSWRSAATFDNFDNALPRVPWLMYVSGEKEEKNVERVASFYDLSNNKTYNITANFPPPHDKKSYVLSCGGWILCVSEDTGGAVNLTHLVWRVKIDLPCLDTFPDYAHKDRIRFITKMVLSCSPTIKGHLVVMVIWGKKNQLGFSRPGDSSWSVTDTWDGSFSDIIYRNGRLYAVFSFPYLPDLYYPASTAFYLVETSGGLLIVRRGIFDRRTIWFEVYEIDLKDGSHKKIHGLPNMALFLGCNSSLCVEVCDWDRNVAKPNCIYFTGRGKNSDRGLCCLSDMSFEGLPGEFSGPFLTPPTWVVPSF
ncbi:hypothetical protein DH2020_005551 [Rehmannia glutinosa]|uniref:F-box protein n=1 Tax=Rehmannia glutinosa TaxID=99300 RepID=A0ABR0XGF7_REHGL